MGLRRLRVLHTESSTGWGGQEIRILTESGGLLERGHEVALICPASAEIHSAAHSAGIETTALPIERKDLRGLLALRQWLTRNRRRFDVVNTHSSTDSWLVALASATLPGFAPLVRTRHVSTAVNRSPTTRWLYQHATQHIVTTGEGLRRQLISENGYRPETITSVPTGIDLERFRPLDRARCRAELALPAAPGWLGILATLRDWKGHAYLFEALSLLPPELGDWGLLVIGDGPYEPTLRRVVASLGLERRVLFVGRQESVQTWLNALDLLVLPSYGDEGVPQSIMQAMACGLAVISTPIGSIAEAVQHEHTGLLVGPRDAQALAEALELLIRRPDLRLRFGEAGLARARERFGRALMLDRMETVFRQVIKDWACAASPAS